MWTGAWWRSKLLDEHQKGVPDVDGDPGSNTILRTCYKLMAEKLEDRRSNVSVDKECARRAYEGHGAAEIPQSYPALRSALNVRSAAEHEHHVCSWCGRLFPRLSKRDWGAHCGDRCEHCGCDRFVDPENSRNPRPRKRAWIRPVHQVVESFLREQDGFEYRSLSYSQEDDVWVDAIYLESAGAAAAINHVFMADSRNQRFMALIDTASIAARHTTVEQSVCMSEVAIA